MVHTTASVDGVAHRSHHNGRRPRIQSCAAHILTAQLESRGQDCTLAMQPQSDRQSKQVGLDARGLTTASIILNCLTSHLRWAHQRAQLMAIDVSAPPLWSLID